MRKEKFCPTSYEEAETHIWADFYSGQVIVETNKKATYDRLLKKLGYGLPFVVDLSTQLIYYDIFDKVYFDMDSLVGDLWN